MFPAREHLRRHKGVGAVVVGAGSDAATHKPQDQQPGEEPFFHDLAKGLHAISGPHAPVPQRGYG